MLAEKPIPITLDLLVPEIQLELKRAFQELPATDPLKAAVSHALFSGGKRIRPLLSLALVVDLKGSWQKLLPVAIALELIHCSSLIHDDLPALDDDNWRRGKPSCHKAFGEATAVLAGDVLVSHAFQCISKSPCDDREKSTLVNVLAHAFTVLCNGQQLDLLPHPDLDSLTRVHLEKTGTLFSAACQFATTVAGLGAQPCARAHSLGMSIGLLFQVRDDFLDVFGDSSLRGGGESSDIRNARDTFFHGTKRKVAEEVIRETEKRVEDGLYALAKDVGLQVHDFVLTQQVISRICSANIS